MKGPLLLSLLLLETVSALHLENDGPHVESPKAEAEQGQDPDGGGEQERKMVLTQEVIQIEGEDWETSGHQDALEDEESTELDPGALGKGLECPREEDTVQIQGIPECKTCNYVLVQTPNTFDNAQNVCSGCYRGNLVSIHSEESNHRVHSLASKVNQVQIWIGGLLKGWWPFRYYGWIDGTSWNYQHWAPGQPGCGGGNCVALSTKGGHWQRASCKNHMPFICYY